MTERALKVQGWQEALRDPTTPELKLRGILRDAERLRPQINAPGDAAEVFLVIASVHFALRNFEKAAEAYQRGYALNKSNPALLNGVGVSHLAAGNAEKAIEFFSRAYKAHVASGLRFDQVVSLSNLAEAYWYAGEREGALEAFREAMRTADENDADDVLVLANQAAEIGAVDVATELLAKFLTLHRGEAVEVSELPAALTATEREFLTRRHGVARLIRKLDAVPDALSRFKAATPVDGSRVGEATEVLEETRPMRGRATAMIFGDPNDLRPE